MSSRTTQQLKVECPSCHKKVSWKRSPYRPFCSERCRLLDLGEWASEKYRIPGEKAGPEQMEPEPSDSDKKK